MNIILEGIDGSGKTTLATHLAWRFGMTIQPSEGPPHYPGEINDRIRRYSKLDRKIFDRHPAISQQIYCTLRVHDEQPDAELVRDFYLTRPLIIYCEPTKEFSHGSHQPNSFDTPEHLAALGEQYDRLLSLYQQWAVKHASYVYRVPEPYTNILWLVACISGNRTDMFSDIAAFHEKFGLNYTGAPRRLPADMEHFRETFLFEELDEYIDAGDNLAERLDALVDLIYVALGNAYQHGFPFDVAWRRVHAANMKKVRVLNSASSARGSIFDVVKPEGWKAPDLSDLVPADSSPAGQRDRTEAQT